MSGQAWKHPYRFGRAALESGPEAPGFPEERKTEGQLCQVREQLHPQSSTDSDSSYLIVQFLQKGNLSCRDSTLRSRSRRAKEALSTSCFEKRKKNEDMEEDAIKSVALSYLFILNEPDKLTSLLSKGH